MFDWDKALVNTNVKEKVFILNKTILNILSNLIPHEKLTLMIKIPLGLQKKNISSKRKTMFIKAIETVKIHTAITIHITRDELKF